MVPARATRRPNIGPDWEYSGAIELVVWAIPALTVMLLGGIAWIGSHDLDPASRSSPASPPIKVEVVSLDWKWLFIYPDQGIATVNQLVVPAGTPISFRLTSATVWNVFFVPQMGTMIYTMPRMTTRLNLQADRQGVYDGLSAPFQRRRLLRACEFKVHARPAAAVRRLGRRARAGRARRSTGALMPSSSKPSSYVKPMTYGAVAPGLFDAIVDRTPRAGSAAAPHNRPAPAGREA